MAHKPKVIQAIYAWICTEPDGGEGIPACAFPGSDAIMPLVGADMERVESLRPFAISVAQEHGLPVKLVRFDRRTVLETMPAVDKRRPE